MIQECVICGSVYVDEQNVGNLDHSVTQTRSNPTEERVDKGVGNLGFANPSQPKSSLTNPPAAIHPAVCFGSFRFV